MRTALLIKSYPPDFGFLAYALKSIAKFVTGISEVVIAVQDEDVPELKAMGLSRERIEIVPRYTSDGYLDQEIHKLVAYRYTDAHQILYFDSDCIAIRRFSPEDLMIGGKPRCLMTPYSKLVNPDGSPATPWQPITEKALGIPVVFEYMRSHPMLVNRRALIDLGSFCIIHHGMDTESYIVKQPSRAFSEWNFLHGWAHHYSPDYFSFWDTEVRGVPEPFVKQHWSYGGITPEMRAEMERLLA
jgi:hypothetical protein